MLYDPKWEVKAEPSVEGLAAWLETMPPDGTYDWGNCFGECLIGLYLRSLGVPWSEATRIETGDCDLYTILTPNALAARHPRTFGAALKRARAASSVPDHLTSASKNPSCPATRRLSAKPTSLLTSKKWS